MLKRLLTKKRYFKSIYKEQKGITGLETAIILIAFVVVAAVFAYTVLSAGLFATQQSQQAVYSGLKQAQSTVEIKGDVIAMADSTDNNSVGQLTFTVSLGAGGEPVDFTNPAGGGDGVATGNANVVTISYIDQSQTVNNLYWTSQAIGTDNSGYMLTQGEKFQITIGGDTGNNLVNALSTHLQANDTFTIEIKDAGGSVLSFQRTMPAHIDPVMDLH